MGDEKKHAKVLAFLNLVFPGKIRIIHSFEECREQIPLLILDLPEDGRVPIEEVANSRHVVHELSLAPTIHGDNLFSPCDRSNDGVFVKSRSWFLDACQEGDFLHWKGKNRVSRGKDYGWAAPQKGLRVSLQDTEHNIVAFERKLNLSRIAGIDLSELSEDSPASDLTGIILLEALGHEAVDMGSYIPAWKSVDSFFDQLSVFQCEGNRFDSINVTSLHPPSVEGRLLKMVTIGDDGKKPVVMLNCCTHGHEWGPTYGIFRWLYWLTKAAVSGDYFANMVLDSFTIVWIPICSVDGFHSTWERGVTVPHGPNWVDLHRNYPPIERWKNIESNRPKGDGPLSEPETRAVASIIERYGKRGVYYSDNHECVEQIAYFHRREDAWLERVGENISEAFDGRFYMYGWSDYKPANERAGFSFDRKAHSISDSPYPAHYALDCGFLHASTTEFFGNSDFTPVATIARTEAAAQYVEQVFGSLLGKTVYNHSCEKKDIVFSLPFRFKLCIIGSNGGLRHSEDKLPDRETGVELQPGERMLAIAYDLHEAYSGTQKSWARQ